MQTIKVAIVDDHKIIRDGLIAIFREIPSIEIVGNVSSGDALLELLGQQPVDVILLDMHMPVKNGIEVAGDVKAQFPNVKILMNTMSEMVEEIESAVAIGVNGYVLKTSGSEELLKAIQMVAHGSSYFGAAVLNSFIKSNANKSVGRGLTPTELKIVKMLYEEKKYEEICEVLEMSKQRLKTHIQNMYRKLKIHSEIGLVKYALKEKLIQ